MEEKIVRDGRVIYYIPDKNIEHNILFDTCAINKIMKSEEFMDKVKKMKELGFNYYIPDALMRELKGVVDRKAGGMQVYDNVKEENESVFDFIKEINGKRVSSLALLLKNYWILDGSFRSIDEKAEAYPMFSEIHNDNIHHLKDAVIAEAAIHNNCTLVTNDKRLNKKVNSHFANRSMLCEEFEEKINLLLKDGEENGR